MPYNTVIVGDSADGLRNMPEADMDKIQYVETELDNEDFAYGGNLPVTFTFDSGKIETLATISAPTAKSGESHRQPEAEH